MANDYNISDQAAAVAEGAIDAAIARDSEVTTAVTNAVAVVTDLLTASGKGFVNHGATAGTARPVGFASVEWNGTVEPDNAVNGDTWVDVS